MSDKNSLDVVLDVPLSLSTTSMPLINNEAAPLALLSNVMDEHNVAENTLEIMSSLQDEINRLKGDLEKSVEAYNKLRLMMFPTSPAESGDAVRQVRFAWIDLVKKDPTLELISQVHKHYITLTAHCCDFVEDLRSKVSIETSIELKDKAKKKKVQETRTLPRLESGRVKLSLLDKAIDGFRKSFGSYLSGTQLVDIIKASPMFQDRTVDEIQASIDKLNLRDAAKR